MQRGELNALLSPTVALGPVRPLAVSTPWAQLAAHWEA